MNNVHVAGLVMIDATSVVIKGLGYSNSASDGTSLVDLLHHGLFSTDFAQLAESVLIVGIGYKAGLVGVAVLADVDCWAGLAVVMTSGSVGRAGLISHLVFVNVLKCCERITSMTAVIFNVARDDNLGGDVDIGPGTLPLDLDPVGHGWGGCMSPARAAVLGNVLISHVGEHGGSIHVGPEELGRKILSNELRLDDMLDWHLGFDIAGLAWGNMSEWSFVSDGSA
jgi:hypothetical protein